VIKQVIETLIAIEFMKVAAIEKLLLLKLDALHPHMVGGGLPLELLVLDEVGFLEDLDRQGAPATLRPPCPNRLWSG
jgi:hypothetical protein